MQMTLTSEHVALVAGGSAGIGLGIAGALREAGAFVAVLGRDQARLDDAVAALGDRALGVRCDVSDESQVAEAFSQTLDRCGRIDSVFVNAGVGPQFTPFTRLSLEEWHRVLRINLDGAFLTAREAARHMGENGGGSIVLTSSLAAHGMPMGEPYAASKGAINALVGSLAVELARHKIRVNAIVPGWVPTGMTDDFLANERTSTAIMARIPMRRWGAPEDIGGAAVFLASEASAYLTGQQIVLDGGYSKV